jgi:formamidopyrimidine-DNA glycosylase
MPELPEVERLRRELEPAMRGARFDRVILRRPDLRTRFPRRFAARLEGQTVTAVDRRAKYLLVPVSSGETLIMHLGMSGWFRVTTRGRSTGGLERLDRHDHVIFDLSNGVRVVFNDPRRFGLMDLVAAGKLPAHPTIGRLGLEPLSPEFDAETLARACAGKKTSLKAALLDQRVVAGLGNIYVSEALHVARLAPQRQASTIATPTGLPRDVAYALVKAIKLVLEDAIGRKSRPDYRGARFRVYDREGARCLRRGCRGIVRRRTQAGRSTFYCRDCQR